VCKTKREAQHAEARFNMLKEAAQGRSNRITFADFVEVFWLPEKRETLRKNTLQGYWRDLNLRLLPAFGEVHLGDINRMRIQAMLDKCPTYKTGKNARDTLSTVLGLAVDMEILARNPARAKYKYKPRPDETKHMGDVVTNHAEHLRIIRLSASYEVRAILVAGLLFGLRKGEILALDWQHIDLAERVVHVRQTYTRSIGLPDLTPPKTPKSVRDLPMSEHAHRLLLELRDWGGVSRIAGPILLGPGGKRMNPEAAYRKLRSFCKLHDAPALTPSSLRHSFATAWVLAGGNVASLSKWLGHTNVSTTLNRYVVPLMGDMRTDAERLDTLYLAAVNA
jgi:integrase